MRGDATRTRHRPSNQFLGSPVVLTTRRNHSAQCAEAAWSMWRSSHSRQGRPEGLAMALGGLGVRAMASSQLVYTLAASRCGAVAWGLLLVSLTLGISSALAQYPSGPQITKDGTAVLLQDYASLPLSSRTTGTYPPEIDFADLLVRVNFLRSEPANIAESSQRMFVNDLNRNLYILDKNTKAFTPYINFEEVFPKFNNYHLLPGGLITFAFEPDYAANGKFYTVHTEDHNRPGSAVPTNTRLPGLDLSGGYTTTPAVNPPAGTVAQQAVLVEWTDTNLSNMTFEGTAREILRVGFNTVIHQIADLIFNPLAQSGDPDYGNLYMTVGDGGTGETPDATHSIPQRLDTLEGKVLRITPDITRRPADELSSNGRYRIPTTGSDPNPFVSINLTGLRKEIYAYGFRNPDRMSWDPVWGKVIVIDIGANSWEEVNVVTKGGNYGYAEREGIEQLFIGGPNNGKTGSQTSPPTPFPNPDSLTVAGLPAPVTPVYPAAQYSHRDGDAISGGFVYRGSLIPELYGKYVFGDITTARLFFTDSADLMANDDGERTSLATVRELQVVFDSPYDNPDRGAVNRRLFDVIADAYARRGGDAPGSSVLPGSANATNGRDPDGVLYGGGRADIRLALGGDGEIYVLSKSDGMIRRLVAAGNLLSNFGFETGSLTPWLGWGTAGAASNYPHSGTYQGYVVPSVASSGLYQQVTAPTSGSYTFQAYVAEGNLSGAVGIGITVNGVTVDFAWVAGATYVPYTVTAPTVSAGQAIGVFLWADVSATGWAVIDTTSLTVSQ